MKTNIKQFAALVGLVALVGCSKQQPVADTQSQASKATEAVKTEANKAADTVKTETGKAVDAAKSTAQDVSDKVSK